MTTLSQAPVPTGLLNEYAGRWIAIRGGTEIVADADTLEELREDDRVHEGDSIFRVPDSDALFF